MKQTIIFTLAALVALSGCNLAAPTAVPTLTPTELPTLTQTSAPTVVPTLTPTATITPTDAPTLPFTATPTASLTPYPTVPPASTVVFSGDKLSQVTIDKQVTSRIGDMWLAFININDRPTTVVPGTPSAANEIETVYWASPFGGPSLKIIDLPATTDRRIYWSPDGAYMTYFLDSATNSGLYLVDLRVGVSLRLFALDDLSPRGILSEPVWSPDSTQLTIALPTAYDVDIFSIRPDGTGFRNLSQSGGFDFWPTWSPDGAYLAFVSDRAQCPTWVPNEPESCFKPDLPVPDGGNLYVLDIASATIRQLSDAWVNTPPHWISSTRISFTSGTSGDISAGSTLWWADLRGGPAHAVTQTDPNGLIVVRDSWSSDGRRVIYQEAQSGTQIVLRDQLGVEVARSTEFEFPRYTFSAAWSPDGNRVVLGGHNSQCPYGLILADETFKVLVNAPPTPGICDPIWSPDGQYIGFAGVIQSDSGSDGRLDVYIAAATGFGTRNISGRLGGQIRLLGWVGKP
jgi:Tol biopolymer transport system component